MERESESGSKMIAAAIVISALAVLLRLLGLGSVSLTMNEAENAMTALRLFENGSQGQLLYELPTALLFKMFGSSEFTARLFPAMMGMLLAFLPFMFIDKIGKQKACVLSFVLAVDPALLFWSKRADAVIPAITMTAAAFAFLSKGKKAGGVACFLIALCGGARCWPAIPVLALCAVISVLLLKTDLFGTTRIKP